MLKEMLEGVGKLPNVFVTDRELALLNAVAKQFPGIPKILCRRHIYKDIEARSRPRMHKSALVYEFQHACTRIFEASTEKYYDAARARMQKEWSTYQSVIDYLNDTWLTPYKENIVRAWVDKITHFGTYTSNRCVTVYNTFAFQFLFSIFIDMCIVKYILLFQG